MIQSNQAFQALLVIRFIFIFKLKGGVIVKMFIDDSVFCFTNVHFEHGEKCLNTRLVNFTDLHNQAFNVMHIGKKKEEKIEQADYKFLIGDLNFRITLSSSEVI